MDGIVNTLCHLLEHLAARGHETILFAPEGGPKHYAQTPVYGLPAWHFPLYRELRFASPFASVAQKLHRFQPDLVHVLNPVSLGLAGVWQARLRGWPLVASYHTDVAGFARRWGYGWAEPLIWAFFRLIHNTAHLNLAPSRITQQELRAHAVRRVKVWGRGVNTQLFNPNQRTAEWRAKLTGGQPHAPLLLYVGRLSPEKRVQWLRPVLESLPQARLAVVGDGPQRAELENLLGSERTVFTGYLRGEVLARAYAAADIFVFPAANETLGNVVLEAMASGLPVVAPRSGGLLDHLTHGRNGLLFEANEINEWVQATTRLVQYPELARSLGAHGRVHAETRRWETVLDGLLDEYALTLNHHAKRHARGLKRPLPVPAP